MPHIEELRRQRAGINEQVQALATIDASGSTLTAEQLTARSGMPSGWPGETMCQKSTISP